MALSNQHWVTTNIFRDSKHSPNKKLRKWLTGHVAVIDIVWKCSSDPHRSQPLSLSNLVSAMDSLPSTLWRDFGLEMDVPGSIRNKIESQLSRSKERKAEVLRVISTEHPHRTWEHVSDVLYQLRGGGYHHVLERVLSLFPTGDHISLLLFLHLPTFV